MMGIMINPASGSAHQQVKVQVVSGRTVSSKDARPCRIKASELPRQTEQSTIPSLPTGPKAGSQWLEDYTFLTAQDSARIPCLAGTLEGVLFHGLALGLNEFAGYLAVGFTAWITGYIASMYALRPQPFYLGIGVAFAGLLLSLLFAKETRQYAKLEAKLHHASVAAAGENGSSPSRPSMREIFAQASWKDRNLFSCSQAGLVNNLNDAMSWGIYPLFFSGLGLGVAAIGTIKAVYLAAWGALQVFTGPLSDRWGRKRLIAGGMIVQAGAIWLTVAVPKYPAWIVAALIQVVGTATVYPTLLAAISDVAHPEWRATTMGVYRFWRDLGYAIGALISGIVADLLGMRAAIQVVAALTLLSGLHVAFRMRETLMRRPERGLGGILVSPAGDWNSDHDHSNDSRSAREVS